MFKEPEINDPSLLRCVVKKSAQVVKKCAIVVTVLAAITIVGYGVYLLLPVFITIAGMIVSAIISIPWYYYVGAVAIAVIPVYSFLWCIARDLTDEDWGSGAANNAAFAVAVAFASIFEFPVGALADMCCSGFQHKSIDAFLTL